MTARAALAPSVFLVLAACNQVFDLEPTISVDPEADVDGDGFPDDSDNCPTIPNDQANADNDAFGDACDGCPALATATTHDEDRDTIGDECDICPGVEDLGTDADGDGIGDDCDLDVTGGQNRRVAFEPFVVMPSDWTTGPTTWAASDDSIAPLADLDINDPGLQTTITTGTGPWASVAGFSSRTHWQPPDRFGLVATGAQKLSCVVTCTSAGNGCTGMMLVNTATYAVSAVPARPAIRVAMIVRSTGMATCLFEGSTSAPNVSMTTSSMSIAVFASPRIRATYFEHQE